MQYYVAHWRVPENPLLFWTPRAVDWNTEIRPKLFNDEVPWYSDIVVADPVAAGLQPPAVPTAPTALSPPRFAAAAGPANRALALLPPPPVVHALPAQAAPGPPPPPKDPPPTVNPANSAAVPALVPLPPRPTQPAPRLSGQPASSSGTPPHQADLAHRVAKLEAEVLRLKHWLGKLGLGFQRDDDDDDDEVQDA